MAAKEDKPTRLVRERKACGFKVGLGIITLFVAMIAFTIFYIIIFAVEQMVAGVRAVASSIRRKTHLGA